MPPNGSKDTIGDLEMAARVAKEETYMEEYNKRNNKSS
jgi:hypothetical protein